MSQLIKLYVFTVAAEELMASNRKIEICNRDEKYDNRIPMTIHKTYDFEKFESDINIMTHDIVRLGVDTVWGEIDPLGFKSKETFARLEREKRRFNDYLKRYSDKAKAQGQMEFPAGLLFKIEKREEAITTHQNNLYSILNDPKEGYDHAVQARIDFKEHFNLPRNAV